MMGNTLPPLASNDLLCGGENIGNIDQNFCPMVAGVAVKKSSGDCGTFAHQTTNGFPMRLLHNDQLHFADVSFRHVKALRIIARCAGTCPESKNYRSFFAITAP